MKEHFVIGLNTNYNFNYLIKIVVCLVLSIAIVYPILDLQSIQGILSVILLFLIIYVIVISITSENLSNELPSTLYPSLPHTGLDGISLNSYVKNNILYK